MLRTQIVQTPDNQFPTWHFREELLKSQIFPLEGNLDLLIQTSHFPKEEGPVTTVTFCRSGKELMFEPNLKTKVFWPLSMDSLLWFHIKMPGYLSNHFEDQLAGSYMNIFPLLWTGTKKNLTFYLWCFSGENKVVKVKGKKGAIQIFYQLHPWHCWNCLSWGHDALKLSIA